jgi:hypothetical protein
MGFRPVVARRRQGGRDREARDHERREQVIRDPTDHISVLGRSGRSSKDGTSVLDGRWRSVVLTLAPAELTRSGQLVACALNTASAGLGVPLL